MPTTTATPTDTLIIDGNTYTLTTAADDIVRLSIDLTNREREDLRAYAAERGLTMRDVTRDALHMLLGLHRRNPSHVA